jgi:two-component system chemotaxis response regulator CheY
MNVPDENNKGVDAQDKRTILVVDDSAYVRRMIRFALAPDVYRIIEAHDGVDALKSVDANRIDLIITDLKMPNMDGFELIRNIRSRSEYEFLPIIMLSGESTDECRVVARDVGVSAFIIKPFVPEQISGLIQSVFK